MLTFSGCQGMDGLLESSSNSDGIPEEIKKINEGSFVIDGAGGSLTGFDYTDINGNLEIRNTDLVHLNEFVVLKRVTGSIIIEHTTQLTNINGLQELLFVGGDLIFTDNDKITEQKIRTVIQGIYSNGGLIQGNVIFDGVTLDISSILNESIEVM